MSILVAVLQYVLYLSIGVLKLDQAVNADINVLLCDRFKLYL